jgi:hypothetical protein
MTKELCSQVTVLHQTAKVRKFTIKKREKTTEPAKINLKELS